MKKLVKKPSSKKEATEENKSVVMIACMNNSGLCSEYRANTMFGMGWYLGVNNIKAASGTWDQHPISLARNTAIKTVLNTKVKSEKGEEPAYQYSHIFFIDSDTFPQNPSLIAQLLNHDEPVVSGWYLSRKNPRIPVILKIVDEKYPTIPEIIKDTIKFPKWRPVRLTELMTMQKDDKGLITVDGCGAGCMLIKREVFEKLEEPYFYEDSQRPYSFGEDLFFGLNCKLHGVQIKVDPNAFCGHLSWGIIGQQHMAQFIREEIQQMKQQQVFQPNQNKPPVQVVKQAE